MGNESYDRYTPTMARYYALAFETLRRDSGDVDFYKALAQRGNGPVLDLGCGAGRTLHSIAELGLDCTGIDDSQAMLDVAATKLPESVKLRRAAMQTFDLQPQSFAFIFSAFRSFQHLLTIHDQLGCLERVRGHLAPGGTFAFDVMAPQMDRMAMTRTAEREDAKFSDGDAEIMRSTATSIDHAHQMMELRVRYERRSQNGSVQSDVDETQLRYFFRYELEHLLARAGFSQVEVFAGFDQQPFNYVSGETVIVARA